jgi:MFS transporter, ACS family, glucarate transporter
MKASRTRYGVVAFALTLAVLSYVQRVAISQAAGPISSELHLTKVQMGYVFGAFGLSYALFEIPMGLMGDRLGVRRVLAQIVLAWSVFTALTGAAWNLVSLWVVRFFFGAGEAGCFPNLTRMLSAWLPLRERVKAQALMWAFARWGGAVTPPLAFAAITLFGWRWSFVAFAALGLVWCGAFLAWFKNDPADHKAVNAAELELLQDSRFLVSHHGDEHWTRVLLNPKIVLLVVQYFCFSFVWYFYVTWLPLYLTEARGQSPHSAAAYAMLPLLFGGVGSLISGFLPLWLPRRRIALAGFTATAVLLFVVAHLKSVAPAMAAMAAASFFSDLTMPISWNACVEIGQRYTATVAAAMNMMGNFAGFVAPVVGGIVLQRTQGDWNTLLYIMVASAFVSAACWLFLKPERDEGALVRNKPSEPLALGDAAPRP